MHHGVRQRRLYVQSLTHTQAVRLGIASARHGDHQKWELGSYVFKPLFEFEAATTNPLFEFKLLRRPIFQFFSTITPFTSKRLDPPFFSSSLFCKGQYGGFSVHLVFSPQCSLLRPQSLTYLSPPRRNRSVDIGSEHHTRGR